MEISINLNVLFDLTARMAKTLTALAGRQPQPPPWLSLSLPRVTNLLLRVTNLHPLLSPHRRLPRPKS